MTTNETTPTARFEDCRVVRFKGESVDVGGVNVTAQPSVFVVGGEYRDEPDIVIEVRHAYEDGEDVSADVARRIAEMLSR